MFLIQCVCKLLTSLVGKLSGFLNDERAVCNLFHKRFCIFFIDQLRVHFGNLAGEVSVGRLNFADHTFCQFQCTGAWHTGNHNVSGVRRKADFIQRCDQLAHCAFGRDELGKKLAFCLCHAAHTLGCLLLGYTLLQLLFFSGGLRLRCRCFLTRCFGFFCCRCSDPFRCGLFRITLYRLCILRFCFCILLCAALCGIRHRRRFLDLFEFFRLGFSGWIDKRCFCCSRLYSSSVSYRRFLIFSICRSFLLFYRQGFFSLQLFQHAVSGAFIKIIKQGTCLLEHPLSGFLFSLFFIFLFQPFPFLEHLFDVHLAGRLAFYLSVSHNSLPFRLSFRDCRSLFLYFHALYVFDFVGFHRHPGSLHHRRMDFLHSGIRRICHRRSLFRRGLRREDGCLRLRVYRLGNISACLAGRCDR